MKKSMKKACTWKARIYRIPTHTPEFDQFDMVFGGSLKADNRWVILASLIPWNDVKEKYSKLFVANNGRPAIPVRVALGALILKEKMKSIMSRENWTDKKRK
jgi:hypothetical protein